MKKESKRHILSTVAVILAAVAAVTVLFVLHHKQQQEKAHQPEESVSQAEDNTIEWNGKRYTYNNNLINILFLGIDHANDIDTSYMPGDAGQADCIMLLSLDKETKEVIKEYPPEKTLDMIAKVWEMAGIMVDEKR